MKSPESDDLIVGRILEKKKKQIFPVLSTLLSSFNLVMVLTALCFVEKLYAYTVHLNSLHTSRHRAKGP